MPFHRLLQVGALLAVCACGPEQAAPPPESSAPSLEEAEQRLATLAAERAALEAERRAARERERSEYREEEANRRPMTRYERRLAAQRALREAEARARQVVAVPRTRAELGEDPERALWPLLVVRPKLTAVRVDGDEVVLRPLTDSYEAEVATTSGSWVVWDEEQKLRAARPFVDVAQQIVVPSAPEDPPITSLYCRALECLVGRRGRVDRINLGDDEPRFEVIHTMSFPKPIDFFVPMGESIVAVDDMMRPKWAIILDTAGAYVRTVSLPSGVNEVVHAGDHEGGDLVLMARSSTMGGHSQRIYRCALQGETADCSYPHSEADPIMDESETPDYSDWTGMVVAGRDVLITAGERGLIRVSAGGPVQMSRNLGTLNDIVRIGDTLYVLGERNQARTLQRLDARGRRSTRSWELEGGRFEAFAH